MNMQVMTWGELMVIIFVAAVVWYAFVVLKYYGKEFVRRKNTPAPIRWKREKQPDPAPSSSPAFSSGGNTHAQVHELMEEIKLIFDAAVRDTLTKEQIFDALHKRLPKYPTFPAPIRQSVNQHIINEFSLQLKINVTDTEINHLWK